MIKPKIEIEDLLLSKTKKCETLFKQTHRKPEETLEFEIIKPRQMFRFNPAISIEGPWMLGLTSLELYNSVFSITRK